MSKEQRRNIEKNRLTDEIKLLHKYNEADEITIGKLRGMPSDEVYVVKQLEKRQLLMSERNSKLDILKDRLDRLEGGFLDDEMQAEISKTMTDISIKSKATLQKKIDAAKLKAEDSVMSKKYYDKEKSNDRQSKESFYNSYTKHFFKASDSIPDYMKRELKKMPCNEGYIWKSIYCFGEQHATSGNFTMTDNQKGVKIIHKWNKEYQSVFEKKGKGPEVLVSRQKRKPKC